MSSEMLQSVKRIALCSKNPAKVAATQTVCSKLFPLAILETVELKGLPDQPIGRTETRRCALVRAKYAVETMGSEYGVGMEGGVDHDGWLINCIAVVSRNGQESHSWGLSFLLPSQAASRVLFNKEEMSPVMDDLFTQDGIDNSVGISKSHGGAIGQLTNGFVSRADTYESPLICAFIPFLHPKMYKFAL